MVGIVLLATAGTVGAEIYKWVDDKGQVHYSDRATAPAADKVELPASLQRSASSARNNASVGAAKPDEQETLRLKAEYQSLRDQENARQQQEEDAEKARLKQQREASARIEEEKRSAKEQEEARRQLFMDNCKDTRHVCGQRYDKFMRSRLPAGRTR
jgi:hypothetical protein